MTEEQKLVEEKRKELQKAAEPLIKYLCEKHHPHTKIIVTQTGVEVLVGVLSNQKIYDFLKD